MAHLRSCAEMPEMSHAQIVHALEQIRAGNDDAKRISDLEMYLVDLLLSGGTAAVGAILLNLEGMNFSLVDAPELGPNTIFRSDHEDNALIVEVSATDDLAVASVTPEDGKVPQLPAGHQWFYGVWERLIGDNIEDPSALPEPDRTVYLIASFEADVMNGGVGQYLSNTDGRFVAETLAALQSVGANKTTANLRKAARLKREDESWDDLWGRAGKQLGRIDEKLMADDEYLAMMTATFFGEAGDD